MIKQVIFPLLFSLCYISATAQIGQTKAYIIKKNELCKIIKNNDTFIKFNCEGSNQIFQFETGLCTILFIELPVSNWNAYQIDLLRDNLKYYGKFAFPSPENPDLETDGFMYSDGYYDWVFYDCNIHGDKKAEFKVVSQFKHLK